MKPFIHPTAEVSEKARIGNQTKVWHYAQIREGVSVGEQCIIGKNVYIDFDVSIGNRCKIQNNCSLYHGLSVQDGVFIGPHVVFANDPTPRAITPDGQLKGTSDWTVKKTNVQEGAAIGANSTILPGVTLKKWCMVGAGSVVTHDVPEHGLVVGNPARLTGFVCQCGCKCKEKPVLDEKNVLFECAQCQNRFAVPKADYQKFETQKKLIEKA